MQKLHRSYIDFEFRYEQVCLELRRTRPSNGKFFSHVMLKRVEDIAGGYRHALYQFELSDQLFTCLCIVTADRWPFNKRLLRRPVLVVVRRRRAIKILFPTKRKFIKSVRLFAIVLQMY